MVFVYSVYELWPVPPPPPHTHPYLSDKLLPEVNIKPGASDSVNVTNTMKNVKVQNILSNTAQ